MPEGRGRGQKCSGFVGSQAVLARPSGRGASGAGISYEHRRENQVELHCLGPELIFMLSLWVGGEVHAKRAVCYVGIWVPARRLPQDRGKTTESYDAVVR